MNWKHWPYWLKGGVIGGGVTIISVALFYSCTLLDTSHGSFLCLPFLFISPMFPFAILFDKLDQIFQYQLPFILLPVVSIVSYFIIGSLVGSLIGYIKSKNKVAQ